MPAAEAGQGAAPMLLDAGVFIGALLKGDRRHREARQVVEQARRGELRACTTASILCEVYGALTWEKAEPRHQPAAAAEAVRLLVEPPSAIEVLGEGLEVVHRALDLATKNQLTARRIHDARHAAAALVAGIAAVCTYDPDDWRPFEAEGLRMMEPDLIWQRS